MSQVAKIVADTMNGYFLDKRYLVAKFIPGSEVHSEMFAGTHRKFRVMNWREAERQKRKEGDDAEARVSNLVAREDKRRKCGR